jgi:hypothetical protein
LNAYLKSSLDADWFELFRFKSTYLIVDCAHMKQYSLHLQYVDLIRLSLIYRISRYHELFFRKFNFLMGWIPKY